MQLLYPLFVFLSLFSSKLSATNSVLEIQVLECLYGRRKVQICRHLNCLQFLFILMRFALNFNPLLFKFSVNMTLNCIQPPSTIFEIHSYGTNIIHVAYYVYDDDDGDGLIMCSCIH